MSAATIVSSGVRIRLRAADAELLDAMVSRLPHPWRASAAERVTRTFSLDAARDRNARRPRYTLLRDGAELVSSPDLEDALLVFEAGARFHVAEFSPSRTFVHAGVVSCRGRAVVLPATSGGGKTTLTLALVRAGAAYLSDEFAPIDEHGRVHPFPKPLSIVQKRGRPLAQTVEALGGVQETRVLPVGLVVLTSYAGSERRWRPRGLTAGEAVLELLQHTASAQRRPREALRRLERMVSTATVLRGARGNADETAALILKRL